MSKWICIKTKLYCNLFLASYKCNISIKYAQTWWKTEYKIDIIYNVLFFFCVVLFILHIFFCCIKHIHIFFCKLQTTQSRLHIDGLSLVVVAFILFCKTQYSFVQNAVLLPCSIIMCNLIDSRVELTWKYVFCAIEYKTTIASKSIIFFLYCYVCIWWFPAAINIVELHSIFHSIKFRKKSRLWKFQLNSITLVLRDVVAEHTNTMYNVVYMQCTIHFLLN